MVLWPMVRPSHAAALRFVRQLSIEAEAQAPVQLTVDEALRRNIQLAYSVSSLAEPHSASTAMEVFDGAPPEGLQVPLSLDGPLQEGLPDAARFGKSTWQKPQELCQGLVTRAL